jgi:hypothetical protein
VFPSPVISDGTKYVFVSDDRPLTITAPTTITATYDTYYNVHYAANVPVTVPADEWVKSGQAATGVFPSPVISDGTKYVFVSDDRPLTITAPTTITATYDTYYYLTVLTDPSITTIPGEGWYKAGTSAPLKAVDVYGYTFLKWDVDGAPRTDWVKNISVLMNSPHTATAHYFTWLTISGYKYEDIDGAHTSTSKPLEGWKMYLYKFYDDFDITPAGTDPSGWTEHGVGTWVVEKDASAPSQGAVGFGDAYSGTEPLDVWGTRDFSFITAASIVSDGTFEFKFKINSDSSTATPRLTIPIRYQDDDHWVLVDIDTGLQSPAGYKMWVSTGPSWVLLKQTAMSITKDVWHTMKIVLDGWNYELWVDGSNVLTTTDTTELYSSGKIGLGIYKGTHAHFDDVCIYTSTETDSLGHYSFTVKDPGTYSVKEVLKAEWTATYPTYQVGDPVNTMDVTGYSGITVSSGVDVTGIDFWNFKWLTVSGYKYVDGTTTGLKDWTFKLYKGVDLYDTAVSQDSPNLGLYSFTVKDPGTYNIKEVLKAGWTATSPTYQVGDPVNTKEVTGYSSITVASGTDVTGKDFKNFKWLKVSGYKYLDYDGTKATDFTLPDWTIKLVKDSATYRTTTTDVKGKYTFVVQDPGTYNIVEVLKEKWTKTAPGSVVYGNDVGDRDVQGYTFSAESGVDVTGQDFWNFEWAYVDGYKYFDANGDGEMQESEPGLDNWDITLSNGASLTDTTSNHGEYSFLIKLPGTFTLSETLKLGWEQTEPTTPPGTYGFNMCPNWDITGSWTLDYDYLGGSYVHMMLVTQPDGTFTGTGNYVPDPSYTWDVDGKVSGDMITFHILYTGTNAGYQTWTTGIIHPDGTMSGTWFSSSGQDGTWLSTDGEAKKFLRNFGNWLGSSSFVTTSGLCWFDMNPSVGGRQFKLILIPDVPTYPSYFRVTSSNPGQFYYNVFYVGDISNGDIFTVSLPLPFVTQGANPVHLYSSLDTTAEGCLIPEGDITSKFTINTEVPQAITIEANEDVTGGFVYITIHADYGYKKTEGGYEKDGNNNAIKTKPNIEPAKNVIDNTLYTFSVEGPSTFVSEDTISNWNVFKRDPGFVGQVTDSEGAPVEGVKVTIYDPSNKLIATVYTDKDGWYFYNYKYTGKAATFTIKLPEYNLKTSVTIKSNSMTVTNFIVP